MPAWRDFDRDQVLAEAAELYYVQRLKQLDIAARLGTTRSTVSRMITEADERGLVEIRVRVPLRLDHQLERQLVEAFGLAKAMVVESARDDVTVLSRIGLAGARMLSSELANGMTVGMTWGSTLQAIVAAVPEEPYADTRVVQVAGALAAPSNTFDPTPLVQQLAQRIGGTPVFLNAPLIVDSAASARALMLNVTNRPAVELGRRCDLMLVGIGKMDPRSTLARGGYISADEIDQLRQAGAVGDACGHPFDVEGRPVAGGWSDRLVGISREDLLRTRVRLGFAFGAAKTSPLLGALKGGYVSHLVTDATVARDVLRLRAEGSPQSSAVVPAQSEPVA